MRIADASIATHAFERAFQAVHRVHGLMSRQEPDSDVARINRAAARTLVAVDPWTWDVLRRAKELHEATGGLFDCTVASGSRGSLDDVELTADNGVVLRRPLAITLDGIAKGYAVDRAIDALRVAGASAGLVNAGGDLRIFGHQMQPILVRHPGSPGQFISIGSVRDAAVATSGRYFSNSALFDPRTMRTHTTDWGATVIAPDCTTADALTKPGLLDRAGAKRLATACGAHAVLVSPRYSLH
jgi:thiamine biosynthesis lipoprotein